MAMSGAHGQTFNSLGYSSPVHIQRNPLGISLPAILNNVGTPVLVGGGLLLLGLTALYISRR